jgi:hypothetical protein
MIKLFIFRAAVAAAILMAPWALVGCDSSSNTKMPTNPPPIQTDAKGNPVPPPTAAGGDTTK